ncbi:hypothetical protein [Serratia proteamaculans]|uniref:hypothetical protein n=1 Tax=Serratia proteamaculans TaxID=28151 RepID=UPI001020E7F3|nr:hypothetical protein [Serratia proteamaculans]
MRKIKSMLSNDIKDSHGDIMHLAALKSMKKQLETKIPLSFREHDFRNAPIARVVGASIESNGKHNFLYGEIEFFDIEDINKTNINKATRNKKIPLHNTHDKEIIISYDKSYVDNNLVSDVEALNETIRKHSNVSYELKKSIEPVSALMIIATAVASNFMSGFLSKPGSDFWDLLSRIIKKNTKSKGDKLYHFCFNIQDELEVMIIFSNPMPDEIFNALNNERIYLEGFVREYKESNKNVRKITFEYLDGGFTHQYSVYEDGTPFDINNIDKYAEIIKYFAQQTNP